MHYDYKNERFDVFTKHTRENVCRAMVGMPEDERDHSAADLLADFNEETLRKLTHKQAQALIPTLQEDKWDKYNTYNDWVAAGQPDD